MSRKQTIFSYSLFVLSCLIFAFFLVVQQLTHPAKAQNLAAPVGQNPLALIKTIVVQGKEVDKAIQPQVTIARGGATGGAEPGMMLYFGDHVTTGKDVRLTILFLDEAAEKDNEVVLDAETHVQVGSLFAWAGRILARVKDKFQTKTTRAQWSVVGTEYELTVQADGTNILRVLKGTVQGESGSFSPPTASLGVNTESSTKSHHPSSTALNIQDAMSFVAVSGKVTDVEREFILTNSCQQRHVYRVKSPLNLDWFQFLGADQFAIDGNGTRNIKFAIRLDATNVSPGKVESQITFPCLDCSNEPGCRIGGLLLPITMSVIPPGGPTPRPSPTATATVTPLPTPLPTVTATPLPGTDTVTAIRMQEVIIPPAGDLRRGQASPAQVEQTLNWSNPVIVPGEPTYSAQLIAPRFQTWSERDRVFREARRNSIIFDDPRSKQILADIYLDWGSGAKAEEELKNVEVTARDLPPRLVTLGEARRLMGDLTSAEALIKRAIGLEPTLANAYNALGTVYLDQAKAEQDQRKYEAARVSLEKAKAEFAKALQVNSTGTPTRQHHVQGSAQAQPAGNKLQVVAQSNIGEVHLHLGEIARAMNDNGGALREFQTAEQAFSTAARTDATYQFAFTGLGDVNRELGETQEALGYQSRAEQYFTKAQDQYSQALRLHEDMAEAHVGLGRTFENSGRKDEALKHFSKATQLRPELPDPHYHFAIALSDIDPARAAEQARAYLKLERAPMKQGERARNAERVISSPGPGPTRSPTPRPTTGGQTPIPTGSVKPPVKIPSMKGDRPEKALAELQGKRLIGKLRNQRDCEATGKVLGTEPGSGETVPADSEVIVLVSGPGEYPVTMPSLRRSSVRDAEAQLRTLDLRPSIKTRETDRDPPQTVIGQKPDAGKQLPAGCPVELTVAIPIPPVIVGYFVGRNMQEIYSLLGGLSLGAVSEVETQEQGGTILRQSLSPGTSVPRGTSINLEVAAVMVYVPDVMNLSRAQAEAKLKSAGLNAVIMGQPGPNSVVTKQDPGAQTRVRRGSRVRLWFTEIG